MLRANKDEESMAWKSWRAIRTGGLVRWIGGSSARRSRGPSYAQRALPGRKSVCRISSRCKPTMLSN